MFLYFPRFEGRYEYSADYCLMVDVLNFGRMFLDSLQRKQEMEKHRLCS